jgi:hypothetical protein
MTGSQRKSDVIGAQARLPELGQVSDTTQKIKEG